MANDDYMGDDFVGDDYVGDDFVGDDDALGALRAPVRALARAAPRAAQARGPQLRAQTRQPIKLRGYLGFGTVTFTSGTLTQLAMVVEPQRSFRPERLIIIRRDGSSATAGLQTLVDSITVGDQPQSPSVAQGAPTEMFSPDATVSGIDFNKCVPGQQIRMQLSISALPTGTELVRLSAGMYGDMMR